MTTNITPEMQERFAAILASEGDGLALFSIFLDGKPTAAIVSVTEEEDGDFTISPLAVMVTPEMVDRITDHDGASPQEGATR